MFKIQTLNTIAPCGLNLFPRELYEVSTEAMHPDAILVRSEPMHNKVIPPSVKVVGRAGAGLNNIPIDTLTARGIPVFFTPGANANAVRELVLAGMLLASRNICQAWLHVQGLTATHAALEKEVEKSKKQFVGFELAGKTLGIIGLGNIGVKVANAAIHLGMRVIGYDPDITVHRAWELSANVEKAHSIDDLLLDADFVSFHVPLADATRAMINQSRLQLMKPNAIILNFSRDGIIDNEALLHALDAGKIYAYVTDFPLTELKNHPRVISLPHLGASTKEAEENCATMLVQQVRDYLEVGIINNAVNFPTVNLPQLTTATRLVIVNDNIPNMVAQISGQLAKAEVNIAGLVNQSRNDIALTVLDIPTFISSSLLAQIEAIPGVLQVRQIKSLTKAAQPKTEEDYA